MGRMSGDDAWRWVVEHPAIFEDDGRLSFVRGADADAIFTTLGFDPARARPRTLTETWGPSGAPYDGRSCVRVAREGEWAAVIEPVRATGDAVDPLGPLSKAGFEVFSVALTTMDAGDLTYCRDGLLRFGMGLGEAYDSRTGELTDRFAEPLRAAGFFTGAGPRPPAVEIVAALAMGSRELGFHLSAERGRGPLPTIFRDPVSGSPGSP